MLIRNVNATTSPELHRDFLAAMGVEHDYEKPWPLPNQKPCTENDFWGWRATWAFKAEAWIGQIKVADGTEGKNPIWATLIVYYVDADSMKHGGFAVLAYRAYCEEKVEYFKWSKCDHKFDHKTTGNCQHRYTCSKCAVAYGVDSSG